LFKADALNFQNTAKPRHLQKKGAAKRFKNEKKTVFKKCSLGKKNLT